MVADDGAIALLEERASSYLLFSALFYQEATKEFFEQLLGSYREVGPFADYLDSVAGKDAQELLAHLKASTRRCFGHERQTSVYF